ncbi:MAG TPA: hypothetical protein V6C90_01985 [Coleofasciculaceae cyanobacterium]
MQAQPLHERRLSKADVSTKEQKAYLIRLRIELVNISMEKKIRAAGKQQEIAILDRLIKCEGGSWASI